MDKKNEPRSVLFNAEELADAVKEGVKLGTSSFFQPMKWLLFGPTLWLEAVRAWRKSRRR